jgi:hypothetical protein
MLSAGKNGHCNEKKGFYKEETKSSVNCRYSLKRKDIKPFQYNVYREDL